VHCKGIRVQSVGGWRGHVQKRGWWSGANSHEGVRVSTGIETQQSISRAITRVRFSIPFTNRARCLKVSSLTPPHVKDLRLDSSINRDHKHPTSITTISCTTPLRHRNFCHQHVLYLRVPLQRDRPKQSSRTSEIPFVILKLLLVMAIANLGVVVSLLQMMRI